MKKELENYSMPHKALFISYARQYLDAAQVLIDETAANDFNNVLMPCLFLIRHTMELQMKNHLIIIDMFIKMMTDILNKEHKVLQEREVKTHSLNQLYKLIKKREELLKKQVKSAFNAGSIDSCPLSTVYSFNDRNSCIEKIINLDDSGESFRYPLNNKFLFIFNETHQIDVKTLGNLIGTCEDNFNLDVTLIDCFNDVLNDYKNKQF